MGKTRKSGRAICGCDNGPGVNMIVYALIDPRNNEIFKDKI
jgi:hypothetical protein